MTPTVRTVQNLREVDLGYRRDNLLRVPLQTDRGLDAPRRTALALDIHRALSTMPGVQSVTFADGAFRGGGQMRIEVDGYVPQPGEAVAIQPAFIGANFFATAGIPLVRGRVPEDRELLDAPPRNVAPGVAVVSASFARKYFGDAEPLGRILRLGPATNTVHVIGVARDVVFRGPRQKSPNVVYLPMTQVLNRQPLLTFWVRTAGDALALAGEVQKAIRVAAPTVPVRGPIFTEEMMLEVQMFQERAIAQIAGVFSGLGLLLAMVGLYGVLAYDVSRRTREIGVRMALGARPGDVLRIVMRKGVVLAVTGAALGLVAATGLSWLAPKLLYGVAPGDPVTLAVTTGILLLVAFVACWLPARRATRIDPMVALRAE